MTLSNHNANITLFSECATGNGDINDKLVLKQQLDIMPSYATHQRCPVHINVTVCAKNAHTKKSGGREVLLCANKEKRVKRPAPSKPNPIRTANPPEPRSPRPRTACYPPSSGRSPPAPSCERSRTPRCAHSHSGELAAYPLCPDKRLR